MKDLTEKKSRRKELRKFGIIVGAAFAALGVIFLLRGKSLYPYFLGLGGVLFLLGLLIPAALGPFQIVWMRIASALGWVMTRLILTVLFFVVVTILASVARLARRDPLKLKLDDDAQSYWIPKGEGVRDKTDYEQQY
jgi:hypothetical protein